MRPGIPDRREVLATHVEMGEGEGVATSLDGEGRAARAWLSIGSDGLIWPHSEA